MAKRWKQVRFLVLPVHVDFLFCDKTKYISNTLCVFFYALMCLEKTVANKWLNETIQWLSPNHLLQTGKPISQVQGFVRSYMMVLLKTCDHGLVHLLPAFSLLLLLIAFRASFVYHDEQNM